MQYNFVEFVKNINLYAIIDGVILLAIAAIMIWFFVYKRNVKMFIFLLAPIVLEVLVFVLSELMGGKILVVAKYILPKRLQSRGRSKMSPISSFRYPQRKSPIEWTKTIFRSMCFPHSCIPPRGLPWRARLMSAIASTWPITVTRSILKWLSG